MIDSEYLKEAENIIRDNNRRISALILGRRTKRAYDTTFRAVKYAANVVRELTEAGFPYPTLKQPLRDLRSFGQKVGMNGDEDLAYISNALEGTESRRKNRYL